MQTTNLLRLEIFCCLDTTATQDLTVRFSLKTDVIKERLLWNVERKTVMVKPVGISIKPETFGKVVAGGSCRIRKAFRLRRSLVLLVGLNRNTEEILGEKDR